MILDIFNIIHPKITLGELVELVYTDGVVTNIGYLLTFD
jgi:hypothetical protein